MSRSLSAILTLFHVEVTGVPVLREDVLSLPEREGMRGAWARRELRIRDIQTNAVGHIVLHLILFVGPDSLAIYFSVVCLGIYRFLGSFGSPPFSSEMM